MFTEFKSQLTQICAENTYTLPVAVFSTGDPGLQLERLFGIDANNRDTADRPDGIELKFTSGNNNLMTMLHLDPTRRSKRGSLKRGTQRVVGDVEKLIYDFGYIDDNGKMSFRHTVAGPEPTTGNRVKGFFVKVEGDLINVYHVSDLNQPKVSWAADIVVNAIVSKMRRTAVVEGSRSGDTVSFNRATLLTEPRSSQVLNLIADGTIKIDFAAWIKPSGAVRNHGVKWRIYPDDLCKLYLKSELVCAHA